MKYFMINKESYKNYLVDKERATGGVGDALNSGPKHSPQRAPRVCGEGRE